MLNKRLLNKIIEVEIENNGNNGYSTEATQLEVGQLVCGIINFGTEETPSNKKVVCQVKNTSGELSIVGMDDDYLRFLNTLNSELSTSISNDLTITNTLLVDTDIN